MSVETSKNTNIKAANSNTTVPLFIAQLSHLHLNAVEKQL